MSRSFHTTRRDLEDLEAYSFSSEEKRKDSINQIKDELSKKRRSKRHVRHERNASFLEVAHTPIDSIPIEITGDSPFLHYPADANDLRELMKILPVGTVDGLTKICLYLGEHEQSSEIAPWELGPQKDPYLGRIGYEALPSIFRGICLGVYLPYRQEIKLHGYVYSTEIDMSLWQIYLKLHFLMTFIHEIGHHYDFTFRLARGRWRGDSVDNAEIYAEHIQHQWRDEYVIPFLREKYGDQVKQLESWIITNVGVDVPFRLLAGDPRSTGKNGLIKAKSLFDTASAFRDFVKALHEGKDIIEARLTYADELHMAQEYDLALNVIALVLNDKPEHLEAMTLKAEIYVHLENYVEAKSIIEKVLALNSKHVDGLFVLIDCYEGLKQWLNVINTADQLVNLTGSEDWKHDSAIFSKANAFIELGRKQEAERITEQFEKGSKRMQRLAKKLRERLVCI